MGLKGGRITVWPRGNFFVADGPYLYNKGSIFIGPVMHHGVKEREDLAMYFASIDECRLNDVQTAMNREEYGSMAAANIKGLADSYLGGEVCYQCNDDCLASLSCEPLAA